MKKRIKIAYIGGGSKQWARVFMNDLALQGEIDGEIALYDIDVEAAERNKKIGEVINEHPNTVSLWDYKVYTNVEEALKNATFVVMSILPGTFEEMRSDVHAPEEYGIYQSVGDTAGPGGVLRAMRTVPIYQEYAKLIEKCCPNAWVINFTNPMSICVKALYDTFPSIKAFGCCHEVFHAQDFLCAVLKEELGIEKPDRHEIYTDASGVNHFTWITEAKYKDVDILKLLPSFEKKYYERGYCAAEGKKWDAFKDDLFECGNKVKCDLFNRYGALAGAGDRHIAEFVNGKWYLKDPQTVEKWLFKLTPVDYRIDNMNKEIEKSIKLASKEEPVEVKKSQEEAVDLMKAILGFGVRVSNVNMPNMGQMSQMPLGSIVETNCVFTNDCVKPVVSNPLPKEVMNLVYRCATNIDCCYEGIKERNLEKIFASFMNQALCSDLSLNDGKDLFKKMIRNTRKYLDPYYPNIDEFLNN